MSSRSERRPEQHIVAEQQRLGHVEPCDAGHTRDAEVTERESGGPVDAALISLFAGPVATARARGARDVEILATVRAVLAGENGNGPA